MVIDLELLKRLAPEEPLNDDEQGGCIWCGWSELMYRYSKDWRGGSSYADKRPETHTADCPWVAARKLIAEAERKNDNII